MKSASAETCRPFTFYLRSEASLLASEAVVALACRERGVSTKAFGLDHARTRIASWVADYNEQRPHSALGYLTPRR
jgi:transposase InsO family protein